MYAKFLHFHKNNPKFCKNMPSFKLCIGFFNYFYDFLGFSEFFTYVYKCKEVNLMYLTIKANLKITPWAIDVIQRYGKIYHEEFERLIQIYQQAGKVTFIGYREINSEIAFHSKEQLINLAKTFYEIRKKNATAQYHRLFVLSAKSFQLKDEEVHMEFGRGFMKYPLRCTLLLNEHQKQMLHQHKVLRLDVRKENKYYVARFILKADNVLPRDVPSKEIAMGIDLGMKCPAVCYTSKDKVKFVGNGRQMKYEFRRINLRYRKLQKLKNPVKLKNYGHKLHNYKKYIDHCISKDIVLYAKQQNVTVIRLEKLLNLQQKFHRHDMVCWSYQRLTNYIEYKANMEGIRVEYVNPYLTTKKCPKCGKINNVKGRDYICNCGFHKHRDLVGAMNILHAPKA